MSSPLLIAEPFWEQAVRSLLRRLPPIAGKPIRLESASGLRDKYGDVHAGSFIRERLIALNCTKAEFPRICAHELFHFVWVRAGGARRPWEDLLRREITSGAKGELGWSAEWRKRALHSADVERRTRRWREYCCESFCDSAAWFYAGGTEHAEFTLAERFRRRRAGYFKEILEGRGLSI